MTEFRTQDAAEYRMVYDQPHREIEPPTAEIDVVKQALTSLHEAGILSSTEYDEARFLAHREAVRRTFEIPWTGITPRMQRLLYALNGIIKPDTLLAAGVFCGYTFVSNAGVAMGPGACHQARRLVGVEIKPEEAARADRNLKALDPDGPWQILAADAVDVARDFGEPIDLLYLDASDETGKGKGIYLNILRAALPCLHSGSVILAHNSVNCADRLAEYLSFVRTPTRFARSLNIIIDGEGLEVTLAGDSFR